MEPSVLEMATELIVAQIQSGALPPGEMQQVLQRTHATLLSLQGAEKATAAEPTQGAAITPAPRDWRASITRHTIACLACGATFKQLSVRHLQEHGLDARSYREKYGIPRTQPLAASTLTARRKQIVQQTRPWEKAPTFREAQERTAAETTPAEDAPVLPPARAPVVRSEMRQRILEVLAQHPAGLSPRETQAALGEDKDLRQTMKDMARAGLLTRPARGRYTVADA
jgi:predicted transcriptional regulator